MRDDDLLECYVQLYEAQRTIPAAQLAALALGHAAFATQLQQLTHAKAQMLGAAELFKPTHEPFEMRGHSRQVYAGQRVYRLRPERFAALRGWLQEVEAFWGEQLGAFKAHAERTRKAGRA